VSPGRVALVGAGPGDPSLLTLRAAELLRAADVVAYDELVSESILALVPEATELLPVGRRAGKGNTHYRLHPEVLQRAQRGLFVVRLKAGDPMIFGRGGEEAQELARAGIPFELVPGISAAIGAAAFSGIPLTHREHSAELVISTGHRAGATGLPPGLSVGRTLVLYMASHELERNLVDLIAFGWSKSTPAALIIAATTADELVITGTLATLSTLARRAQTRNRNGERLPALVLVGDVVGIRARSDWRSNLPLRGLRIVVPLRRSTPTGARVACSLRTLGGEVIELQRAPARWPSRVDFIALTSFATAHAFYAMAPSSLRTVTAIAMSAGAAEAARRGRAHRIFRASASTLEESMGALLRSVSESSAGASVSLARPPFQEFSL
jgi:uroporphyrinogen III methyltransferase / synthase